MQVGKARKRAVNRPKDRGPNMRIAVMGAGSIGGYFGGMLSRGGHEVALIARGPHLEAIQDRGLRVVTDDEEFTVSCDASGRPEQVGPVDLALLTVKTYHNAQAVPAMRSLLGPDTVVLCLQNGIDSYQPAADFLGPDRVMPGAAYIEAALPEPGVVRQTGAVVRIEFGEIAGGDSQRGRRLAETLAGAGIPAVFTTDIHRTLWSKFLFIATLAGTTSLARETLAELDAPAGMAGGNRGLPGRNSRRGIGLGNQPGAGHRGKHYRIYGRLPGADARIHALGPAGRAAPGIGSPERGGGPGRGKGGGEYAD